MTGEAGFMGREAVQGFDLARLTAASKQAEQQQPQEDKLQIDESWLLHDRDGLIEKGGCKSMGSSIVESCESHLLKMQNIAHITHDPSLHVMIACC